MGIRYAESRQLDYERGLIRIPDFDVTMSWAGENSSSSSDDLDYSIVVTGPSCMKSADSEAVISNNVVVERQTRRALPSAQPRQTPKLYNQRFGLSHYNSRQCVFHGAK